MQDSWKGGAESGPSHRQAAGVSKPKSKNPSWLVYRPIFLHENCSCCITLQQLPTQQGNSGAKGGGDPPPPPKIEIEKEACRYRACPEQGRSRSSSPSVRFPPSFIHQVIIMTGLNRLSVCSRPEHAWF